MKCESIHIYSHLYFGRIVSSVYIFLNIVIILIQFLGKPTFFFKYYIFDGRFISKNAFSQNNRIISNYTANQSNDYVQDKKTIQSIFKSNYSSFPVDLVYTWVDEKDDKWLSEFINASKDRCINISGNDFFKRFGDTEELRYSLRSAEKNLPWIRYIYIVTWENQRPDWIDQNNPKLKFISHSEIFPENIKLPTFNSKSIDFMLYKIPGLSENFIYSNDDMYFGQQIEFNDLFTSDGKPIIYSYKNSWPVIHKKFELFLRDYNKTRNDEHLFMLSLYYTLITFENKFHKLMKAEFSHIPIPLTKTICEEVYLNFKEEIDKTVSSRFRSPFDLQMQTMMIQYGLYKNLSIFKPRNENNTIFLTASVNNYLFRHLPTLFNKLPKFLAINIEEMKHRDTVRSFIDFIFNETSSYELKDKPPMVQKEQREYWKQGKYNQYGFNYLY